MDHYVTKTLVVSCPRTESPTSVKSNGEMNGFTLLRSGAWCGPSPKDPKAESNHIFLGQVTSPSDCYNLAAQMEAKFFAVGTEKGFNLGKCYAELTEDKTCA